MSNVRDLIAKAADDLLSVDVTTKSVIIADAVLTALREAGYVVGRDAELTDGEITFWGDVMDDCDGSFRLLAEGFDGAFNGLALIRVEDRGD